MEHKEYLELKKKIDYHMDRYYNLDLPEISDDEYDHMMMKLKTAEKEHPEWIATDSPTQKIGGTIKREFGVKSTHNVPMLSIEDVFSKEEVETWIREVKKVHPDAVFSVEQKIDGLSMTLRYSDGKLILAETRGDGLIGEDVTANALVIEDVRKTIPISPYLEIRGEVYMTKQSYEDFNSAQEKEGKKLAANPRNLAAGTLRQLDSDITKKRKLNMFIFNVQATAPDIEEDFMKSHTFGLDKIANEFDIAVVPHKLCSSEKEVMDEIEHIGNMRNDLPYGIDGAVVKIDQIEYRKDFPSSAKYSSGHIAYKYPAEEKTIVMDEIIEAIGRTGKMSFVGHFHDRETGKPAYIGGTIVQNVTLNNQDYINENQIGIGGEYKLKKSGEIIPKLCGLVKPPKEIYKVSTVCPVCGEPLVKEPDTADVRCINPACKAQLVNTISYFVSRECMNIMGLGDTYIEDLVNQGFLKSYADIYNLKEKRNELISLGIIGKETNTDKLLNEIEKSKSNDAYRFLAAIGIRNVGKSTATKLMKKFGTIDSIRKASVEELTETEDVGEITARFIKEFFNNEKDNDIVNKMIDCGVNTICEVKEAASNVFGGKTFVITGTLPTMSRSDVETLITENGGKCSGSVSKKTDFLVCGENAGSKLTKATELGVKVISEEELKNMV